MNGCTGGKLVCKAGGELEISLRLAAEKVVVLGRNLGGEEVEGVH